MDSSDVAPTLPHEIDVEFYSNTSNRTYDLINNDIEEKSVSGRNRWYKFFFKDPVFLTGIEITADGYSSWNSFELEVEHIDGTRHEERINVKGNIVELQLGKLATAFKFRPDQKILASPVIQKVRATGLTLREFHEYEWALREFEKKSADLKKREVAYANLQDEIKANQIEKKQLDGDIGKASAQLTKLQSEVSAAETALLERRSQLEDAATEVESKRDERRRLNSEISEGESRLEMLTRELRLFPSEISGFIKEGNRSIKWYLSIGAPFLVILIVVAILLFSKAVDLTQLWRREQNIDIWTIFLTRIPFVLVAITIIEVAGYIAARLIFEIVRINRQRLEFAKLSIVAKDVSAAASAGLGLDDEEIFESETRLKMELLREHMKNQSTNELEYRGSALISAIVGVAEKYANRKK